LIFCRSARLGWQRLKRYAHQQPDARELHVQYLSLPLHRKHLSLIQMVLLTHLKAGFEKRANRRCDGDDYRSGILLAMCCFRGNSFMPL